MGRRRRDKASVASGSGVHEGVVIEGGPVRLVFAQDEMRFGRRDRAGAPQLVIRREDGAELIDIVIEIRTDGLPTLERPVAHFPPEAMEEVFKPVVEAIQQAAKEDWSPTSAAELVELGLVVMVAAQPELLKPLGFKVHERGMRMDMTRIAKGKVRERDLLRLIHDPDVLDSDLARTAPPGTVLACDPQSDDPTRRFALIWIPHEGAGLWLKRQYDRFGGRSLAELVDDVFVRRLPARTRDVVEVIVRELDLREFVDVERLQQLWKTIAGRGEPSPFEAVSNRAWERVQAIEHFFSAGRFAAALARAHLAVDRPDAARGVPIRDPAFDARIHRLEGFESESLRDAICKLVEAWEFAVGELGEAFQDACWASGDRDAYDRSSKATSDHPADCLAAFKRAGVDKRVVEPAARELKVAAELRNLWTHRGTRLDDRFFRLIGTPRAESVVVCGRTLQLDAEGGVALTDAAMRSVAHRVGRSIADLAAELARVAPAAAGDQLNREPVA